MRILTIRERMLGSNEGVTWLQSSFDYQLPEWLVDFVCKYGSTKTKEYLLPSKDDYFVVSFFLPIESISNPSIEKILPAVRDSEEGVGRNDLLPFAIDASGNPFYVSIGATDKDNVYLDVVGWDLEEPILKIADSFEHFIDKLQSAI